jgi:hypothetical protein
MQEEIPVDIKLATYVCLVTYHWASVSTNVILDLNVDEKIILKRVVKMRGVKFCTGFIWLSQNLYVQQGFLTQGRYFAM